MTLSAAVLSMTAAAVNQGPGAHCLNFVMAKLCVTVWQLSCVEGLTRMEEASWTGEQTTKRSVESKYAWCILGWPNDSKSILLIRNGWTHNNCAEAMGDGAWISSPWHPYKWLWWDGINKEDVQPGHTKVCIQHENGRSCRRLWESERRAASSVQPE